MVHWPAASVNPMQYGIFSKRIAIYQELPSATSDSVSISVHTVAAAAHIGETIYCKTIHFTVFET